MLKNLFVFVVLILIGISFWLVPNFREIAAGVAILLFGMIALENGFKSFAEGPLRRVLSKATDKFYKSFIIGAVSTATLQSSSLISVITISFISAGLLSLHQGIGIIFGANLGTTATAWLVATLGLKFNISALAIPMIVFGVVFYLQSRPVYRGLGNILAGLGFFFFGIAMMKEGFDAYQNSLDLSRFGGDTLFSQISFLLVGIGATVILQSSSASMAIILTALAAGQITYLNAMSLAIGANVGTTVTSMIGAVASNVDGKRVAFAHLLFNLITGLVAFIFLGPLGRIVDTIAVAAGIDFDNYTLKLAIFHTLFNTLGILIMRPLVIPLERLLTTKLKPQKTIKLQPRYLNEAALAYPQASIGAMKLEINHLFDVCFEAIAHGLGLSRSAMLNKEAMKEGPGIEYTHTNIDEIYYKKIKIIYGAIVKFGSKAQKKYSEPGYISVINDSIEACRYFIEVVKDVKDLQYNVLHYSNSDNQVISSEYNKLRKRIAKFIRLVFYYQNFELTKPIQKNTEEDLLESINQERALLEEYLEKSKSKDVLHNGSLPQLILDKKLTDEMVTSLINDSRIVYSINKHLMKASALLYLNTDVILSEIEE